MKIVVHINDDGEVEVYTDFEASIVVIDSIELRDVGEVSLDKREFILDSYVEGLLEREVEKV